MPQRNLLLAITVTATLTGLGMTLAPEPAPTASVSGTIALLEDEDAAVRDLGNAVVWLEGENALPATPRNFEVVTSNKLFAPRILVVPLGSTVSFPNNDPFNHNVFSRSTGGEFDLGLYGRGASEAASFARTGVMSIYCNVHPGMSALIHVRDNRHYTQPGGDGGFSLTGVPEGTYLLHAWHERAADVVTVPIRVTAAGVSGLSVELDARGYRFVQHDNKFGRPYPSSGRRY